MAVSSAAATRQVTVHVINDVTIDPLFHIQEDQLARAVEGSPDLRERLRVTVGWANDPQLFNVMEDVEAIIAFSFPHRELVARAPRLGWIHQTGAGIEHLLPLDWLPEHIVLTNSRGVHAPKAGEFVACALLLLNNLIPIHVTHQRKHEGVQVFNSCIDGKTLVVIGVGNMGGAGARRAKALGLHVIGVNRSGRPHPDVDKMHPVSALRDVLPGADFVLVTAPLTPETRRLVGPEEIAALKAGAALINMGRSALVDYDALIGRLQRGELSGAVLDVFDQEPLPSDSPLWDCDNLILTPHVSSDALDYSDRVVDVFLDNLRRYLAGESLLNRVDPRLGY
jgi:glyoxylate/hydroxypyruvate reductase